MSVTLLPKIVLTRTDKKESKGSGGEGNLQPPSFVTPLIIPFTQHCFMLCWQGLQSPQQPPNQPDPTMSPTFHDSSPSPTATTLPIISWPGTSGLNIFYLRQERKRKRKKRIFQRAFLPQVENPYDEKNEKK